MKSANKYILLFLSLAVVGIFLMSGCSDEGSKNNTPSQPVCETDYDCPLGQNCIDGECLPEGMIPCTDDYDCPIGSFCQSGVCSNTSNVDADESSELDIDFDKDNLPDSEQEISDIQQHPNLCKPCNQDPDCEGDQNFCVEDNSGKKYCLSFCQNTNDCPQGYICRHFEFGNQCYPQDGFCESTCIDTGCEDGLVCNPETGQCEQVQHGTQGFCDPCNSDADCQEGGKCIPDSSGNTFCGTDCTESPCDIPNTYCKYIDSNTKQCWPVDNTCNPACDCSMVNCPAHTQCNPANCNCDPGPDHCANTGCPSGQQCDYNTGECSQTTQNCCTNPTICTNVGMVCNMSTCQCETPSGGRCTTNANCNLGEVCTSSGTCEQAYCVPCTSSFDCPMPVGLFDDVTCKDGYCLPSCFSDANCPAGSTCEGGILDLFAYCEPITGSCNGSQTDGDVEETDTDTDTEDPCGGVTYSGECRENVLYWCEDGTLKQQDCTDYHAVCAQWTRAEGGDDGFFCRGVEGGACGGTKPACMPDYECVNEVCTSQSTDGDEEIADTTDTIDEQEEQVDEDLDLDDAAEEEIDETYDTSNDTSEEVEESNANGQVGDPCPSGYEANCDQSSTDTCITNSNTNETFCSKMCASDTVCDEAASGWCCAPIGSGNLYCIPPEFCSGITHSGICADPILIPSLPYTDTNTISGSSYFEDGDGKCGISWGAIGPEKIYAINLNAEDKIKITTSSDLDIVLYMADLCRETEVNTCIGSDDYVGSESLEIVVHERGTYYIIVDTYSATASGSFTLHVEAL